MKNVGLITEYNPFHNGHKYHIDMARETTGCDTVIVVMSGDFTQRGAPSLMDKYSRASMALDNGADLVIELPLVYANASAEYFASGAVLTLNALGLVDTICFGCEDDDYSLLHKAADILVSEPDNFKTLVKDGVNKGMSFPSARSEALMKIDKSFNSSFLNQPNNILAIEYIKCIIRNNLNISVSPLKRTGSHFHSHDISAISSATAIRHALSEENGLELIKESVPHNVSKYMSDNFNRIFPVCSEDFKSLINYRLLSLKYSNISPDIFYDVSEDLGRRILSEFSKGFNSVDDLIISIKSKQYTYTRIERCLFHILFGITKADVNNYIKNGSVFYINVLGFNKRGQAVLKEAKETALVPVLIKKADAKNVLNPVGYDMFSKDLYAAELYNTIIKEKFHHEISPVKNDYLHKLIIK